MSDAVDTFLEGWLARREPQPPPELSERLRRRVSAGRERQALAGASATRAFAAPPAIAGEPAAELANLAVGLLEELARQPDGAGSKALAAAGPEGARALAELRDRAGRLLEADALLTYALEAAAEQGPHAVSALAAWLAPARLAALLPDQA